MVRVDACHLSNEMPSFDLGYPRGFEQEFSLEEQKGQGGFAAVYRVVKRSNGHSLAAKVLRKHLSAPNVSPLHQERHLRTIEREVAVLRALRSTLNVVHLDSVYEDEDNVYIIMELCTGGELWHRIGLKPYSEETVGVPHAQAVTHQYSRPIFPRTMPLLFHSQMVLSISQL